MGKALLVALPEDEGDLTVWNIGIWASDQKLIVVALTEWLV